MSSHKHYLDELTYLREVGREFAQAHPQAAPLLAEAGSDPDVERLLEGFAFLTGKLRAKLDDDQGSYNQQLIQMLWPHYLRPIPSATILQFAAVPRVARETITIRAGTPVQSRPVDGTACIFSTIADTTIAPIGLVEVEFRTHPDPLLRLRLKTFSGATFGNMAIDRLRLHLAGERAVTRGLHVALLACLARVELQTTDGQTLPTTLRTTPVGFTDSDMLVPGTERAFPGMRLLQEYFAFPQKFMFVDVMGLGELRQLGGATSVDMVFRLSRVPSDMPPVSASNIQLNCVPAVNAFAHRCDPLTYDPLRTGFKLRPLGADPAHYEIHRVTAVRGVERATGRERTYRPMLRPGRRGDDRHFYTVALTPSPVGQGLDQYLGVVDEVDGGLPPPDVLVVEAVCTNRQLPSRLGPGDVVKSLPETPVTVTFRNLTRPTPSFPPPAPGALYWRIIAHFGLSHASLASPESLREIARLYDFPALVDRQLERAHTRSLDGIEAVRVTPTTRLLRGAPVRGLEVAVTLSEEHLGGEGELYLFGSVLNELFAHSVSLNSFTQLTVTGSRTSEVFAWPARSGRRAIL